MLNKFAQQLFKSQSRNLIKPLSAQQLFKSQSRNQIQSLSYNPIYGFSKIRINDETSDPDFQPQQKQEVTNENSQQMIDSWVKQNPVVLFMKGSPQMPMCGYSNFAVEILKFYKIKDYKSVDILQDEVIRREVKAYSNWPTYPQLYINGNLVGGSDIINEMHKDGSLKEMLEEAGLVKE